MLGFGLHPFKILSDWSIFPNTRGLSNVYSVFETNTKSKICQKTSNQDRKIGITDGKKKQSVDLYDDWLNLGYLYVLIGLFKFSTKKDGLNI